MADDNDANTPVLEDASQRTGGSRTTANASGNAGSSEGPQDRNNRGNFTRNLNKESDAHVAKKMFFGGLCLLPWLHCVNVIHYRKQLRDPTIDAEVTRWTRRSLMSFCLVTIVFMAWIVLFQLKWKEFGWANLAMSLPQSAIDEGW